MAVTGSNKTIVIVAVVVVAIIAIAGAFMLMNNGNEPQEKETLIIATSPDFPNYEYMYGTEFVGIDLDIIRAVCYELNYEPEFTNVIFNSIIPGIVAGKYDVGASGFTINDERKEVVNFSDPYVVAKQVVVSPYGGITTEDALEDLTLGVQLGTTGDLYVTDVLGVEPVRYNSYTEAMLSLQKGDIDAIVMDDGPAKIHAGKYGYIVDSPELSIEDEEYGFVFNLSDTALQAEFNEALSKLSKNGTLQDIIDYYADAEADKPSYYANRSWSATAGIPTDTLRGFEESALLAVAVAPEGESNSIIDDIINALKKAFIDKDRYQYVIEGLKNTLIITALSLVLGLVLGVMIAIVRSVHDLFGKFKTLNAIFRVYITVIRGTPVMLQLLIIYYVVFASSSLNILLVASVAFGLNSAAYVAEIMRAGINAVPKGQLEASASLGLRIAPTMILVVLPQAFKNILPALCNEGITLMKETSVSGYIGVVDLTRAGDIIRGQTFDAFAPLIVVAAIYLALVMVLTYLVGKLEKRLNENAV